MLDNFKYKIYEIRISGNAYMMPKFYVKLCLRYGNQFLLDGSHFEYCNKWWKNQNLRLLPSKFLNGMV